MLDPRRLLTFREVAHRGSFSRAADALALTQPAVSQQVSALERQLGARLLDRGPGGPVPTEAGALLLAHADAIADRLAQAGTQLGELLGAERETLRVGAFPSALGSIVPAAIARVHEQQPDVQIEAIEGPAETSSAGVASGALHLAVCFQFQDATAPLSDDTDRHELGEERMLAMLPAGHPLAGRRRIDLSELAAETWSAPSREHLLYRACVAAGFEPRIAYVTRDPLAIGEIVAGGLAVTLAPEWLAGRVPGCAFVALDDAVPGRLLYALTPAAGVRPAATLFVDALRDALSDRRRDR